MRAKGDIGSCSSCGQPGHNGTRSAGCSKTYLAAKLVLDGKATISEAAIRYGIRKQTVSERLITRHGFRVHRAKSSTP
jgi:hypothetical protein